MLGWEAWKVSPTLENIVTTISAIIISRSSININIIITHLVLSS